MTRDEAVEFARKAGHPQPNMDGLFHQRFANLVAAHERKSFYGQDKPAECASGCPPNQICDYCQIVAPVREMIAAEQNRCIGIIHGQCGSDNVAQRTVDAIRSQA